MSTGPRPTRRALLLSAAAAGAAALAACTRRAPSPRPAPTPVDPDAALLDAARARETDLVAAHEAAIDAHPALAARLAPLLEHHRAHLRALGGTAPAQPSPSASAGAPAGTATRALARLSAAEAAAGTAALRTLPAASPRLRPLLASVGACEGAHAVLLESRA